MEPSSKLSSELPSMLTELETYLRECNSCGLAEGRTNMVFGRGYPRANILFIGEGPGADEDKQGKPFVGKAGQLLDKIIAAAQLPKDDIYIANVVKCRPPGNRLPLPDEVSACKPFLIRQIQIIKPKIIVCLGALATQMMISPEAKITRVRGSWVQKGSFLLMPTFHPAALLRDESKKRPVWEDMKNVKNKYLELCGGETERNAASED